MAYGFFLSASFPTRRARDPTRERVEGFRGLGSAFLGFGFRGLGVSKVCGGGHKASLSIAVTLRPPEPSEWLLLRLGVWGVYESVCIMRNPNKMVRAIVQAPL